MAGARQIGLAHPDAELDLAARAGDEAVAVGGEIAGDQREQIGGLGEGIVPLRPVPPVRQIAAGLAIAVGEQHRIELPCRRSS